MKSSAQKNEQEVTAQEPSQKHVRSWRDSVEWGRKAFHITSTLLAVWVYFVVEPEATLGLAIATVFVIAVDLARLRTKLWALWMYRTFPMIFRRDERHALSGASVMMAGATITSYLFGAGPAAAGILCLAWGDSAAAVIGQAVSHRRQQLGLERVKATCAPVVIKRGNKTWAGTTACFVASAVVIAIAIGIRPVPVLVGAVSAAAMERWTPGRWDNLTIPMVTAGMIQICLTWVS